MKPLFCSALACLLVLAVLSRADEVEPVLTLERGGILPRIEAADAQLAQLAGKQFGLRARLRLQADGAILARQTPDRKAGGGFS